MTTSRLVRKARLVREAGVLEDRVGAALAVSELTGGARPRVDRRYQLVGLLGRGANGVVVEAKDERLDRDVALKLFANWDDRVLREARSIAKLDHPNVIRVHDVGVGELASEGESPLPCAYLSMALVRGKSMRDWLASDKPSQARIRSVLASAGDGLAAAHEAGLVHRDIKPENIMVGTDDEALVVDFGLARPPPEQGDLTTLAGTPPYMAPEALSGEVSDASDVYAYARVTVEVLTGLLPSDERGLNATLVNFARPLKRVLRRALSPDPKHRPKLAAIVKALRRRPRRGMTLALLLVTIVASAVVLFATRRSPTVRPMSACAEVAGYWAFTTRVDHRGTASSGVGAQGQYELGIEADCGIGIGKTGWRNPESANFQPITDEDQYIWSSTVDLISPVDLKFEAQLGAHYEFILHFAGDQVRGSFRQLNESGRTYWRGLVTGQRRPTPVQK